MKTLALIFFLTASLLFSCNNTTINNQCVAQEKPDCICTMEYDPVCGCDGVTYGNSCEAECNSITDYTKGKCED